MNDPHRIQDSWNNGVEDRQRQNQDSMSAMLKTYVAVAHAIANAEGMAGGRRIKENVRSSSGNP